MGRDTWVMVPVSVLSLSAEVQHFQTHGTHQTGGGEGTHVLREAFDTIEDYGGEAVPLCVRLSIADKAVHLGIHDLHLDGVFAGFQLPLVVHLIRGFPQEIYMFAVDEDIGHLTHFAQINAETCGQVLFRQGEGALGIAEHDIRIHIFSAEITHPIDVTVTVYTMHKANTRDGALEVGCYARALQTLCYRAGPYISTASMPDASFQTFELRGIITAPRHTHGFLSDEENTLRDQLMQFLEHFDASLGGFAKRWSCALAVTQRNAQTTIINKP